MVTVRSARVLPALVVATLTTALVVPLASPADAGTDRCVDVEVVSVADTIFDDHPLFDIGVTPTVELRLQLTNGDQNGGWTDELGTFDCPGSPLAASVSLEVFGENHGVQPGPSATTTGANGLSPTFAVTNTLVGRDAFTLFHVRASVSATPSASVGREYWWWGQPGFPGDVECVPRHALQVVNETRNILVTAMDSWGDPVAGAVTYLSLSGDHSVTLFDGDLTDASGQLSASYTAASTGYESGTCFVDLNGNGTYEYDLDGGATSMSTRWTTAGDLASGDVEVDADSGDPAGSMPATVTGLGCDGQPWSDLNDPGGPPSDGNGYLTDDSYDASRMGLPVNGVVRVCVAGITDIATGDHAYGRVARLSRQSGPGLLYDADGVLARSIASEVISSSNEAVFYVKATSPGTTVLRGSVDGITDTDTVTLQWSAPTVADARVLACSGGGWTTLPATAPVDCTVTDGLGNPVPGVTVAFAVSNSDGATAGTPVDQVSDGNGETSVVLSSAAEGRSVVTVEVAQGDCDPPAPADGPDELDLGKPAATCVVEVPVRWSDDGAPAEVTVDDGDEGDDGSGRAGDDQTIVITIVDANGDPVDGVDVDLVVDGANPDSQSDATGDDGVVTFVLDTANAGNDAIEAWADMDGDGVPETRVYAKVMQRHVVARFAGLDRRLTAVLASQERFANHASGVRQASAVQDQLAGAVVLARQDVFADALAGTPLAAANDAPLLLTPTAELHPDTLAEIDRVLADGATIFLLGGEAALSSAVEDALDDRWDVERIGGATRYETAVLIAQRTNANPSTVLVTTGTNFADALTAGAAASAVDGVVVLSGDSTPVEATTGYLATVAAADIRAVGGPAARAYPALDAIVGDTRFETGLAVADAFFTAPEVVGIARGYNFPDGLSGGAHIGNLGGPLLLVRGTATVEGLTHPDNVGVQDYLVANKASLYAAYVYGGASAVAEVFTDHLYAAIE